MQYKAHNNASPHGSSCEIVVTGLRPADLARIVALLAEIQNEVEGRVPSKRTDM